MKVTLLIIKESESSFAALHIAKGLSISEKPRERYKNPHETGMRSQHGNVTGDCDQQTQREFEFTLFLGSYYIFRK